MGIGRLQCHVIDVNDLAVAEAFWSEVTGLPVIPSVFPGRCSYLGQPDPWRHEVILHLVRTEKGPEPNRSHVDIWVRDVDRAIEQVEAIGGRRKRSPVTWPSAVPRSCRDRHGPGAAGASRGPLLPEPARGIALTGSITITHADGTSETAEAGQVHHWPAGHTGATEGAREPSSEVGPLEPMREFSEHARKLFS